MAYACTVENDLSLLALEAAIELDNVKRGRPASLDAVKALAKELEEFSKRPEGLLEPQLFHDPNTITIMNQAFIESQWGTEIMTIEELITEALKVSDNLSGDFTSGDVIEKVKSFCVALSKSAASNRRSIYDLKPSHPFRK